MAFLSRSSPVPRGGPRATRSWSLLLREAGVPPAPRELKVLLIFPPARSTVVEVLGTSGPPLGLAYLASALEEEGHDVRILDCLALGYGWEELAKKLRGLGPDVVGITSTTPSIYDAYRTARLVKAELPNALVVLGGPHATFMAEEVLAECPHVDAVVAGEGELTFCELVNRLAREEPIEGIRGLYYRAEGLVKHGGPRPFIKDVDAIPWPAYHLLPMHAYSFGKKAFCAMLTSRGCPYRCVFCASSRLMGNIWRGRSVEDVLGELKLLVEEYGIKEVEFLDDTFTLDMRRAERLAREVVRESLDVSWSCSSRANTMSRRLALELRRAGCHTIYLGIESANQSTLNWLRKGITVRQAVDAARAVRAAGLNLVATFILGIPCETREMMERTIRFARRLKPTLAQFTIFTPYPGTEAYAMAVKKGLLLTRDWSRYDTLTPVMKHPSLSPAELLHLFRKAYLSFYARLSFIINAIRRHAFSLIARNLRRMVGMLGEYLADAFSKPSMTPRATFLSSRPA